MDRLEIVHLIEKSLAKETLDFPNMQRELQEILNYLKLLFLGEKDIAAELKWPEWAIDKGGQEKELFRKALYRAFNGQCFWTGNLLDYSNMGIDHVIPKAKGGPDNFLNYVPCDKIEIKKNGISLKRI